MLSTLVFLILVEALILCGAKFAGKGFIENPFDYKSTMAVRGILPVCIILHHISQTKPFQTAGELSMFVNIGFLFVGLFFFFSGYGLYKSYERKENYLDGFFSKRILTVLIPLLVMNVIYFAFSFHTEPQMPSAKRFLSLTGITLANSQAWYVIVAIIMYMLFYFSFKFISNKKISLAIIFAASLILVSLFIFGGHFFWWVKDYGSYWWLTEEGWKDGKWWRKITCWWFQGEWWVNSLITFFCGIVVAMNEKKIIEFFKKLYWVKFALSLAVIIFVHYLWVEKLGNKGINYWDEFDFGKPMIDHKAVLWCIQTVEVIFFCFFVYMLMMKVEFGNPVIKFLGNYSLELYLMQGLGLTFFAEFFFKKNITANTRFYFAVAVFASTFALALAFKFICSKILSKVRR